MAFIKKLLGIASIQDVASLNTDIGAKLSELQKSIDTVTAQSKENEELISLLVKFEGNSDVLYKKFSTSNTSSQILASLVNSFLRDCEEITKIVSAVEQHEEMIDTAKKRLKAVETEVQISDKKLRSALLYLEKDRLKLLEKKTGADLSEKQSLIIANIEQKLQYEKQRLDSALQKLRPLIQKLEITPHNVDIENLISVVSSVRKNLNSETASKQIIDNCYNKLAGINTSLINYKKYLSTTVDVCTGLHYEVDLLSKETANVLLNIQKIRVEILNIATVLKQNNLKTTDISKFFEEILKLVQEIKQLAEENYKEVEEFGVLKYGSIDNGLIKFHRFLLGYNNSLHVEHYDYANHKQAVYVYNRIAKRYLTIKEKYSLLENKEVSLNYFVQHATSLLSAKNNDLYPSERKYFNEFLSAYFDFLKEVGAVVKFEGGFISTSRISELIKHVDNRDSDIKYTSTENDSVYRFLGCIIFFPVDGNFGWSPRLEHMTNSVAKFEVILPKIISDLKQIK